MRAILRGISVCAVLLLCGSPAWPDTTKPGDLTAQLGHGRSQSLQREARLIVDLLQNYHFSGRPFRDVPNDEIVDRYLDALDPKADFFTATERAALRRRFNRTLKSVYIFRGDLQPAFEIFDRFSARATARLAWIDQQLAQPLTLTAEEASPETDDSEPPKDEAEADRRWRRDLQEMILRERLAGYDDNEARRRTAEKFTRYRAALRAMDPLTIRESFIDATLRCYDPHSGYFSAESARQFSLAMGAETAGVGIAIEHEGEQTLVTEISPGGPADLQSDLRPGDILLELAPADEKWSATDKLRRSEISALLRGDAGTVVRVKFKRPGEDAERITSIRRALLIQTDERARGAVCAVTTAPGEPARRVGWIVLPSFYGQPDNGPDTVSATKDVRSLIEQMQNEPLDGLVMDLRDNPGGLLLEATSLAGLFIRNATIIHAGQLGKEPLAMVSEDAPPAYAGPVVILTSSRTASAGEAFAGAMQFHHRAVVVGDETTFGKGSMQIYLDLAKPYAQSETDTTDWGTVRVTSERYYLPDGQAVQGAGIRSDIVLPAKPGKPARREADLEHVLPGGTLALAQPPLAAAPGDQTSIVTPALLEQLQAIAQAHTTSLPEWDLWRRSSQLEAARAEPNRSLSHTIREEDFAARLSEAAELRRAWHAWTQTDAWDLVQQDVPDVQKIGAAHEEAVTTRAAQLSPVELLQQRHALRSEHGGKTREIPLGRIEFLPFVADAAQLASVFTSGSNRPVTAEALGAALREIGCLERRTHHEVFAALRRHVAVGEDWTEGELAAGFAALLGVLPTLDAQLSARPRLTDVPLREAMRLAAAWAQHRTTPPANARTPDSPAPASP